MNGLLDRMAARAVVFDGAMGTMLYARGVFINTCYDELNLTRAALVTEIHRAYVDAGADVIETNTFGANRVKLAEHGLADKVEAINQAGAQLARQAAGEACLVAGAVGPCLKAGQAWDDSRAGEIEQALREQVSVLCRESVDLVQLETFTHPEELALAARVARESGLPVAALFSVRSGSETALGGTVTAWARALDEDDNVDVIGINCGVGPSHAYEAAEAILSVIGKPLVVMPNAGMPKEVDGRMIYMTSPEYFTSYARKLIQLGCRGVGGCCGTTPDHIRVMAKAVKAIDGVKEYVRIADHSQQPREVEVVPTEQKTRLSKRLAAGCKVTSVELLPPKSCDLSALLERSRACHEQGIDAINIPDGPRASARVSPMVTAMAIHNEVGIEPVLHYCCRDRNLIGMQSDFLGAQVAGVHNMLIITGDPPKLGDYPNATGVFDVDSLGLTQVARNLNHGRDIGGNPVKTPTSIFIGVGANPCAISFDHEVERYAAKIRAGAEFAITQPVFDPDALFRFLDAVEESGCQVPVIAGVWPLVSFKNAEFMRNEVPGVEVPDSVMDRMSRCRTREEGIREGIAIAREICRAIAARVSGYQVSAPFGRVELAFDVLEGVG